MMDAAGRCTIGSLGAGMGIINLAFLLKTGVLHA